VGLQIQRKQHFLATNFINSFLPAPLEQLIIALFVVVIVDGCIGTEDFMDVGLIDRKSSHM